MRLKGYIVRKTSTYFYTFIFAKTNYFFGLAYAFLNPKKQGKLLAVYIIGIAVGQCIVFVLVTGVIHFRQWLLRKHERKDAQYTEGTVL
jgi:hypothetical protein